MGLNNNNKLPPKEKLKQVKSQQKITREERKRYPFLYNSSKYIP